MKYCKKCHILYSDAAAACPKCGVREPDEAEAAPGEKPEKGRVVRDWVWIAVGVPVLIAAIYALIKLLNSIG